MTLEAVEEVLISSLGDPPAPQAAAAPAVLDVLSDWLPAAPTPRTTPPPPARPTTGSSDDVANGPLRADATLMQPTFAMPIPDSISRAPLTAPSTSVSSSTSVPPPSNLLD